MRAKKAGRLESWEARRLGGEEAIRLGSWEAMRLYGEGVENTQIIVQSNGHRAERSLRPGGPTPRREGMEQRARGQMRVASHAVRIVGHG